jgi:undecaprenyl-diphosphatase
MIEHVNLILFSVLNAHADLTGWQLLGAMFAAEWLIFLVPFSLVLLWASGTGPRREVAARAFLAAACALTLNAMIGHLWYSPRPFVAEVGKKKTVTQKKSKKLNICQRKKKVRN